MESATELNIDQPDINVTFCEADISKCFCQKCANAALTVEHLKILHRCN